ncbi:efflux RND transporter permease subunit [Desulfuribacillus alkaliarsenatis]|uniref:Multidrug ABC transporter n=1 Tax=Desulfuribacillus alkaliarsenatis TaxID=766136 RepID=A0A1E5G3I7_9FIRM|nr:efflux RND transporter permease subunit [Desulfuribacillus alkaliarsenatis]OEF97647.1 multidrug ABC transporter [Desulfuribacillus alkaliarsenatis]
MKISHISINRPVAITMLVIAIVILGMVSVTKLNVDLYPDLVFPMALVITSYDGASPHEVENLVTRPLEEVLGTIENLKDVQSVSQPGSSQVMIEFNWGTDMDFAVLDIRERVDMVKAMLPEDANDPMVLKLDIGAMPIQMIGLSGGHDIVQLKEVAEDVIKPRLERVPGVASVGITGGKSREIQVVVDPERLNAYGLTLSQVSQTLMSENITLPGGDIEKGTRELYVRMDGEFKSSQDISEVIFHLANGSQIKLKDFAEVKDGFRETKQVTRMNGIASIEINIFKQTDANTVQVSNQVTRALEQLINSGQLPSNMEMTPVFDQAMFIQGTIDTVIRNIIIGGVIALFVLYLFLRNFRSTLVISLAMPFAIIATFTMLYFAGQTLNMMTLGGLALGVGMMVDSAIVVLENIYRHRQLGKGNIEAAKVGASEVGLAVLAASFTTIAVFLPIVFVDGMAAQFFQALGLTVSISIFASLMVALTLIPMLASRLLKVESEQKSRKIIDAFGNLIELLTIKYKGLLRWALSRRKTVVFATLILLIASMVLVPFVGTEFIPVMDMGEMTVDITMPKGTIVDETERITNMIEEYVYGIPELDTVFTTIGASGGMDFSGATVTERANLFVKLVPLHERVRSTSEVVEELRAQVNALDIPDAEIRIREADAMGDMGAPLQIRVQGDDLDILQEIAYVVTEEVKLVDGTREVKHNMEEGRPELLMTFDRERLARYGISNNQIMTTVRTAFQGQVATRLKLAGEEIDVRVIYPEQQRQTITDLEQLSIRSQIGIEVPLYELVSIEEVTGPSQIYRQSQVRQITVESGIHGRDLGSVMNDIRDQLDQLAIPEGYHIIYGGQSEEMMSAFADLLLALILAIILVYIIMAAQFEAFTYPFIIMFSLPATFIGVVVGLFVTGRPLSVTAFIGIIMLAGIVVNNAIVLVDYINRLRAEGMDRNEAILQAGPVRLRPILMTTLTTVLALIPLAIGWGEGAEAQAPMATVVVFGLSFSTLITLVLIPVVYTLFDDLERKVRGWFIKEEGVVK